MTEAVHKQMRQAALAGIMEELPEGREIGIKMKIQLGPKTPNPGTHPAAKDSSVDPRTGNRACIRMIPEK